MVCPFQSSHSFAQHPTCFFCMPFQLAVSFRRTPRFFWVRPLNFSPSQTTTAHRSVTIWGARGPSPGSYFTSSWHPPATKSFFLCSVPPSPALAGQAACFVTSDLRIGRETPKKNHWLSVDLLDLGGSAPFKGKKSVTRTVQSRIPWMGGELAGFVAWTWDFLCCKATNPRGS